MASAEQSLGPDGAEALSPTLTTARVGFAVILVATFAWGIWIASGPDTLGVLPRSATARTLAFGAVRLGYGGPMPAVWDFLSITATPIGFAFLLLVRAEALRPTMHAQAIANAGSAAAIVVAAAGLGTGIWSVIAPPSGAMWGALAVATVPLGVGITLLVSAAALRDRGSAGSTLRYGLPVGLAIIAAGGAMGIRVLLDPAPYISIPTSILAAVWPAGVGLLLLITGEDARGSSRFAGWGVALGGLLAAASLASAIWFALEVYSRFGAPFGEADRFLPILVQIAVLPISIAVLGGVVAFGLKGREVWAGAPALGWTASVVLAAVTAGYAARVIAGAEHLSLWAFVGVLIVPLTIAALVALEAQRCRQLRA